MAAPGASSVSSSFATLLKQSKFATYSPAIAQVYTTHGGHAHRGDWGVKRPLSVRQRGKTLLIQSIDSPEQQTEFRSAAPEEKFVKRWEETGVDIGPTSTLHTRAWSSHFANRPKNDAMIDSEFANYNSTRHTNPIAGPAGENHALAVQVAPSTQARPEYLKMNKKEFERYLERLRRLRPLFRKYLEKQWAQQDSSEQETPYLYKIRKEHETMAADRIDSFLDEMSMQLHGDAESQTLEPYPHRNGGLFYPTTNWLQTYLLYPPVPSHVISSRSFKSVEANAVGLPVKLTRDSDPLSTVDWQGKDVTQGRVPVRFAKAGLIEPPNVVANPSAPASKLSFSAPPGSALRKNVSDLTTPPYAYLTGLEGAMIDVEGVTVKEVQGTNIYRPGSMLYSTTPPTKSIGLKPQRTPMGNVANNSLTRPQRLQRPKVSTESTLSVLDKLIGRIPSGSDPEDSR